MTDFGDVPLSCADTLLSGFTIIAMKTIVRKIIVRFYYNCYEDDCQKDNCQVLL